MMCKNDAFVTKIVNTRLTKFSWPFLPPTKGCQVLPPCISSSPPKSIFFYKNVQFHNILHQNNFFLKSHLESASYLPSLTKSTLTFYINWCIPVLRSGAEGWKIVQFTPSHKKSLMSWKQHSQVSDSNFSYFFAKSVSTSIFFSSSFLKSFPSSYR